MVFRWENSSSIVPVWVVSVCVCAICIVKYNNIHNLHVEWVDDMAYGFGLKLQNSMSKNMMKWRNWIIKYSWLFIPKNVTDTHLIIMIIMHRPWIRLPLLPITSLWFRSSAPWLESRAPKHRYYQTNYEWEKICEYFRIFEFHEMLENYQKIV